MKLSQAPVQTQTIRLSQQQQQSLAILKLPTLELRHQINQICVTNPVIDLVDDIDFEPEIEADDPGAQNGDDNGNGKDETEVLLEGIEETSDDYDSDDFRVDRPIATQSISQEEDEVTRRQEMQTYETNLMSFLMLQIIDLQLNQREKKIAECIIYNINDKGRLDATWNEILNHLPEDFAPVSEDEYEVVLTLVQNLDPPGIAARSLEECWLLQLNRNESPDAIDAISIISNEDHCTLLRDKKDVKLKQATRFTDTKLLAVKRLIASFDPFPGSSISNLDTPYMEPDVIVTQDESGWKCSLPEQLERKLLLTIDPNFLGYLDNPETESWVKGHINEAERFISSVEQRTRTILQVARAIIERQVKFLENGLQALQPLMMSEIANVIGRSESTVSRAVSGKWIQTPHGPFPMRRLFPNPVQTDSGEATSTNAVQALIKTLIDNEAKEKPLSDKAITTSLASQGIKCARRTVMKYRKQLGYGSTRERRLRE